MSTFEPLTLERGITHDAAVDGWSALDANASSVAFETIELQNEGFVRDRIVTQFRSSMVGSQAGRGDGAAQYRCSGARCDDLG